ncbi:hypothetical protein BH10BAC5_BH10BAC5_29410 [soil metagenome]
MKTLLLFYILITFGIVTRNDNTPKYKKALNYIFSDTSEVKKKFFDDEINERNTIVANVLVPIKKGYFGMEIAEYDTGIKDKKVLSVIADSLFNMLNFSDTISCKKMINLVKHNSDIQYKIYFSKVDNNQISAEIIEYNSSFASKNYVQSIKNVSCWFVYYFCFNDQGQIVKVFESSGCY